MEIELKKIKIMELVSQYVNNDDEGVVGFGGSLNIRPKYQREFVYKDKQRNAVIDTVRKGFPLNVMYWVDNGEGSYEVLDGQQRSISICEYVTGGFSYQYQYFHNLTAEEKEQILNYELMVYFCKGTAKQKLDWFKTINIAGEKLTPQELRNAVYTGPWLSSAKRYFSKNGCPAYDLGSKYVSGSPIRQDYLETALSWINEGEIEQYMAENQFSSDAKPLWEYFESVINWVKSTFTTYRKELKGLNYGWLYREYGDQSYDPKELEKRISALMLDDDVTKKSGIYLYVLTGDQKWLNIRAFTPKQKREAYERQGGVCPICSNSFTFKEMEADHIVPWSKGGKTNATNCQMLCVKDNREKSGK